MQWPKLCGGRNTLWRHTADHGGGFLPAPTAVESTELVQWAFESRSWPKVMSTALLTRVFRQCFVEVLNKIRVGEVPDEDLLRKFLQQGRLRAASALAGGQSQHKKHSASCPAAFTRTYVRVCFVRGYGRKQAWLLYTCMCVRARVWVRRVGRFSVICEHGGTDVRDRGVVVLFRYTAEITGQQDKLTRARHSEVEDAGACRACCKH